MASTWQLTIIAATLLECSCFATRKWRGMERVGLIVSHLVNQRLQGCNVVFVSITTSTTLFNEILCLAEEPMVVMDTSSISASNLQQALLGDWSTTCRGLILNLDDNDNPNEITDAADFGTGVSKSNNTAVALRLLDQAEIWKMPKTRVVVMGGKSGVETILLHPSLRNSIHAVFLVFHHLSAAQGLGLRTRLNINERSNIAPEEVMSMYRRCMYCDYNKSSVELVFRANLANNASQTSLLFQSTFTDSIGNFNGHVFRVTTLPYFPYMDFIRRQGKRGGQVSSRDSLDVRLLKAFALTFNFTYQYWEEPNRSFGDENNGLFNGMIGQLQREEADLSTIVAPTPGRLKAVDFLRLYPSDMMVIVSLKPSLLPEYQAVIRPFSGYVWISIVVGVLTWVMIIWMLQHIWKAVVGISIPDFNTTLMYSWGALLEKPPADPSVNMSGQMMVGIWLIFCLVICTGFRSSLIAHLTVKARSKTLETLRDLVEESNWNWATEPWLYNGAALEYFSKHPDPVVKKIHSEMKVLVAAEALAKIIEGRFSFIIVKNYISVVLATRYTDKQGRTPFYISKEGFYFLASFGWGFRKGAPFYGRFQQLMHRLEDTGMIRHWTEEVIARRVRETRAIALQDQSTGLGYSDRGANAEEVLGMNHLQGAFYLLLLGSCVAFLILLIEIAMQVLKK